MNQSKMQALLERLEQAEKDHLDMSSYFSSNNVNFYEGSNQPLDQWECGTTACVAGHVICLDNTHGRWHPYPNADRAATWLELRGKDYRTFTAFARLQTSWWITHSEENEWVGYTKEDRNKIAVQAVRQAAQTGVFPPSQRHVEMPQ
jgi:hypothetical protein